MMNYKAFNKYVLRAPLNSFSFYKELTEDIVISDEKFKSICKNKIVKEAIFLATPTLYYEVEKWLENKFIEEKNLEKIKYSVLKYISRMSSRCSPFGLFAGINVGNFADTTLIKLNNNSRYTRLDMNYLVALSQGLIKKKRIRSQVKFYPNSSIYEIGNQIRYVEYIYIEGKRNHNIVEVENSEYLQNILINSKEGTLKSDLVDLLINDEIDQEMANEFIEELINSQLLISELEPSVSGDDFFEHIISVLSVKSGIKDIVEILKQVNIDLKKIDTKLGNDIVKYIKISESLSKLEIDFDLKYLFQTDLLLNPTTNYLSNEVLRKVFEGFKFLNKIAYKKKETNLTKFSKSFYERYGEREMQFSKVLDVEIGLGYIQKQQTRDNNPLINDLILTPKENNTMEIQWTKVYSILQREILKALKNNNSIIRLKNENFKDFDTSWNDLPDTLSTIIQIVKINGKEKIFMDTVAGSSAANLLGRFCYGDKKLFNYVEEIISCENDINENKLLAEINHLPESRLGNVLARPSFRKYEIPYLAKSNLPNENQIELNDLRISVVNNENFLLKSKKHNKVILPRLSNAHYYTFNSLPIYHFLCDLQSQGLRKSIGFNLTPFQEGYEYLPRVEYCDIILAVASWFIKTESIKHIVNVLYDEIELLKMIKKWKVQLKIPQYVLLIEGDNELLINLNNLSSIKMFLHTIKRKNKFKITEFLFDQDSVVKNEKGECYTNQIIVSFYKSNSTK